MELNEKGNKSVPLSNKDTVEKVITVNKRNISIILPNKAELIEKIDNQFNRYAENLDTSALKEINRATDLFYLDGNPIEEYMDVPLFFGYKDNGRTPSITLSEIMCERELILEIIENLYDDSDYLRIHFAGNVVFRKDGYISKKFSTGYCAFEIGTVLGDKKSDNVFDMLEFWVLVRDHKTCYSSLEFISRRLS